LRDYRQLYRSIVDLEDFDRRMLLGGVFAMFQACEEVDREFKPERFFEMVHEELDRKKLVKAATDTRSKFNI